jgi:hypothetical protein
VLKFCRTERHKCHNKGKWYGGGLVVYEISETGDVTLKNIAEVEKIFCIRVRKR